MMTHHHQPHVVVHILPPTISLTAAFHSDTLLSIILLYFISQKPISSPITGSFPLYYNYENILLLLPFFVKLPSNICVHTISASSAMVTKWAKNNINFQ